MNWRQRQEQFYSSKIWISLRDSVMAERGRLCERCLKNGIYKAADVVHHVRHVTPRTIDNPEIALNPSNLVCLCTECHAAIHSTRRWYFNENGKMIVAPDPPMKKS